MIEKYTQLSNSTLSQRLLELASDVTLASRTISTLLPSKTLQSLLGQGEDSHQKKPFVCTLMGIIISKHVHC
jgi:hypothetical protein